MLILLAVIAIGLIGTAPYLFMIDRIILAGELGKIIWKSIGGFLIIIRKSDSDCPGSCVQPLLFLNTKKVNV